MPTLSNCQLVTASASPEAGSDWLRATIWGEQVPRVVTDSRQPSAAWRGTRLDNLLDKLASETQVSLFVSPTGVIGYYNAGNAKIDVQGGRIWGTPIKEGLLPGPVELRHVQIDGSLNLQGYVAFAQKRAAGEYFFGPGERVYMRTLGNMLPQVRSSMPEGIPQDDATFAHVSFYLSQAQTVTNLHWDLYSGAIHQLQGRKRIIYFPPEDMSKFAMQPDKHLFDRRSSIDDRLSEATLAAHPQLQDAHGFECILEPDQWAYLPARWLHYVETLDDNTVSLITRFKR